MHQDNKKRYQDLRHKYSWVEIDKNALEHNIALYKNIINGAFFAAVIKSNAYGHGLFEIATILEHNMDVDWICVADLSSALFLRESRITKPILVLSSIDVDPVYAVNKNIDLIADDYNFVKKLQEYGKKHNYSFSIHIKVDTGLSRHGIMPEEVIDFIELVSELSHIRIVGLWSHFSESLNENQEFTQLQIKRFESVVKDVEQKGIKIKYKHLSNSAGTTRYNNGICNMFRIGLGIYGYWPSLATQLHAQNKYNDFFLKPVLIWKTRIIKIKNITAGSYVGYDRAYQVKRNTIIALLPVGYYDGYDVRFSNKTFVFLHNQYAPIIGRVCMNIILIDVTNIPFIAIGDEVILLGQEFKVTAEFLCQKANIKNVRNLLTGINYFFERRVV